MAFTTANLSLYHSFSKMPAQNSTTLGNAINKSGHTVTASEVWAQDIPYYGKMGSLDDVKSKVQPYARKNDMCYITAGADKGKTFQYDGNGNWTDITTTLVDGALIKNANDDVVLLYHKGQTLTNLTADNNANTDSANNAARLWAKRDIAGAALASGSTRLIEQFVAPTDKALNGLASVAYAPVIANGSLISGTNYYDYCFSGTILWASARTTATVIDCFEYVGEKVSDVVDTVNTQGTAIQNVKDQVDTISDALGLGSEVVGTTLGSRVTDNENALKVLLGLAEGDKVAATESIATTAANAVSTSLAGSTDGTIGKAIADAKQEALEAINAIQHFSVEIIPDGQTIENVTPLVENTIYLVKEAGVAEGTYIEYIAYKPAGSATVVTEKIGSTAIDLSGYTTDAEHTALADRVTALDAATTGRVAVVEGEINTLKTTTIPAIQQSVTDAITTAQGYTDTTLSNALKDSGSIATAINAAKEAAIANAKVTLTAGNGITIPNSGEKNTEFDISVDTSVIATKTSVDELSGVVSGVSQTVASNKTELEGKITAAQTTLQGSIDGVSERVTTLENVTVPGIDTRLQSAESTITSLTTGNASVDSKIAAAKKDLQDEIDDINTSLTTGAIHTEIEGVRQTANAAKTTADTAVQSVSKASGSSSLLSVTQTGTSVTVGLSDTVATKSDITTEINKLSAADGAITALDGRVSDIETSLAAGGETAEAIADAKKAGTDAQTAADAKVADVTVDGTSIVSGADGAKKAAFTTTKGVEITPNETSTSTALATEASVAKALASITSVGVSYEVIPDGQTHTSITAPVNGRIYLEKDTTNAEAGVYIEWMYTEKGWEQIGSTKTDHSSYASKITVNGSPKTVANSEVDLGAFASSVTAGNGVASGSVSDTGALSLTLTTASTETAGITKLDSTIADSTSETTAATPKAVKEYADTKVGSVKVGNEADLLGLTATIEDGTLNINGHYYDTLENGYGELEYWIWDKSVNRVINNRAYNGDVLTAIVETDKIVNGTYMFYYSSLSEFSSDLSNLKNGRCMFSDCDNLKSFCGDLSSLTNGEGMFCYCDNLKSFCGDLSSLTNGNSMFNYCDNLKSFCGDLSSLTNGNSMFYDCLKLTAFSSDLSSLTSGDYMFTHCNLDTDSVECIADTINDVTKLERSNKVTKRIDIYIENYEPNDDEDAAFRQMQDKGWSVYVDGSDTVYVPRTGEASLDETGETTVAPKPYWAKPIEVTEDKAEYVGQDGKFYQVVGGQFIYVNDPDTYGMFVSLEDAVANMRLTKYEKPVEEA